MFNALTRGHAEVASYRQGGLEPNLGVVKVPDPRIDVMAKIYNPKRVVHAEIKYVDIAGSPQALGKGDGFSGPFLNYLGGVDAIIHVVRAFRDASVPHELGSINAGRDISTMNLEMAFSDALILERRIERLGVNMKGANAQERETILDEQAWLRDAKELLEKDVPLRQQSLNVEHRRILNNFPLLSAKPLIILVNVDEDDLPRAAEIESALSAEFKGPYCDVLALCGKVEMDLAQMEPAEAAEFRGELGISEESALDRFIRKSYELLGLISFLTVGPDEVRAWTIPTGTLAPQAASKIHSDIERGFIRAEVVPYDELAKGGMVEAKRRGTVRLEGKGYEVLDGDVVNFLFNV